MVEDNGYIIPRCVKEAIELGLEKKEKAVATWTSASRCWEDDHEETEDRKAILDRLRRERYILIGFLKEHTQD